MSTSYEYTYDYDVRDSNKTQRAHAGASRGTNQSGAHTQRTAGYAQSQHSVPTTFGRTNNYDPLVNLQHDRIWGKLYDPVDQNKVAHGAEIQRMARRQDRKVIKLEAAYGSDRQTIIVKRDYDLRVRDVQEDASKVFKMPVDQIILYWKGRNICNTPNDLLENLGVENNHQLRVCREDDPAQQNRRRELLGSSNSYQQGPPANAPFNQPPPPMPNQYQQQNTSQRTNYYQQPAGNQMTAPPVVTTFLTNIQIGIGDRVESLVIGRSYPTTIYDLQVELQQRFSIPIHEQNLSYNGTILNQYPPDTPLDAIGVVNNSFVSVWTRSAQANPPPQQYYSDAGQPGYNYSGQNDMSPRRMDSNNNQTEMMSNGVNPDVLKIEVFHGSDRHILILRSTNNLRIADLMEELERITTVPVQQQKLFFRGQELQNLRDRTLREAGVDNNAQVRLIGDPTRARYDAMITGNRAN